MCEWNTVWKALSEDGKSTFPGGHLENQLA
jgi:hypothetical protein